MLVEVCLVYDGVDGGIEIEEHSRGIEQLLIHCVEDLVCEPINSDEKVEVEIYDLQSLTYNAVEHTSISVYGRGPNRGRKRRQPQLK